LFSSKIQALRSNKKSSLFPWKKTKNLDSALTSQHILRVELVAERGVVLQGNMSIALTKQPSHH
jgi:hypothetical protein